MGHIDLAQLRAQLMQRFEAMLDHELAAIAKSLGASPAASSVRPDDPAAYWLANWSPRPGEIDPKDEKLWLTKGRAETVLNVGKWKIDELIRDYDISVMYGGRRLINRYRAFAALHGNLPRRSRTGVSG